MPPATTAPAASSVSAALALGMVFPPRPLQTHWCKGCWGQSLAPLLAEWPSPHRMPLWALRARL